MRHCRLSLLFVVLLVIGCTPLATTQPAPALAPAATPVPSLTPTPTSTCSPTFTTSAPTSLIPAASATPSASPTLTLASTATPTPTPNTTATVVPTPRPSHTATPVRAVTPTPPPASVYTPPALTEPTEGSSHAGQITFRWQSVGTLQPDEVYDVRAWRGEQELGVGRTTDAFLTVQDPALAQGPGMYRWRVVVIRIVGADPHRDWQVVSPLPDVRTFFWGLPSPAAVANDGG